MLRRNNDADLPEDEQQSAEVATISDPGLLAQFAEMAAALPAEPGGGTEDILKRILGARTWDELDRPWRTDSIKDILGKQLRLVSVQRRPSTYDGGIGLFCIVKATDPKTGEEHVKTTSSVAVIGQLCWLYFHNASAILFEWCQAVRPTERGYYPQHLKIIDAAIPGPGDGQ